MEENKTYIASVIDTINNKDVIADTIYIVFLGFFIVYIIAAR